MEVNSAAVNLGGSRRTTTLSPMRGTFGLDLDASGDDDVLAGLAPAGMGTGPEFVTGRERPWGGLFILRCRAVMIRASVCQSGLIRFAVTSRPPGDGLSSNYPSMLGRRCSQ